MLIQKINVALSDNSGARDAEKEDTKKEKLGEGGERGEERERGGWAETIHLK
jgi:hypothetical protein